MGSGAPEATPEQVTPGTTGYALAPVQVRFQAEPSLLRQTTEESLEEPQGLLPISIQDRPLHLQPFFISDFDYHGSHLTS
jgi:hypothetical protein